MSRSGAARGTARVRDVVRASGSHSGCSLLQLDMAGLLSAEQAELICNLIYCLQWGPVDYHKKSLQNLQLAMKQTRRLCAVLLDTLGRELMIRRSYTLDEKGWPKHEGAFEVKRGAEVTVTTDMEAVASSSCLPITYPNFHNLVNAGDTLFVGR